MSARAAVADVIIAYLRNRTGTTTARIRRYMLQQHGVMPAATSAQLTRLVRAGRIVRTQRGVYGSVA